MKVGIRSIIKIMQFTVPMYYTMVPTVKCLKGMTILESMAYMMETTIMNTMSSSMERLHTNMKPSTRKLRSTFWKKGSTWLLNMIRTITSEKVLLEMFSMG